jgi:hypothetical protein
MDLVARVFAGLQPSSAERWAWSDGLGSFGQPPQDQYVLVLGKPLWVTFGDGIADVLLLEERRARYEYAVTYAGHQGDAFFDEFESGGFSGGDDHAGDVGEFAVAAVGAGGDDDVAAGAKDGSASGEDFGEAFGEGVVVAVGEVVAAAVPVVELAAPGAGGADDLPPLAWRPDLKG